MPKYLLSFLLLTLFTSHAFCQIREEEIYTDVVLRQHRAFFKKDMEDRVIRATLGGALDSNSEFKFESACWSISQFLINGPEVLSGFQKMFGQYESLSKDTRESLLEAAYAVYPGSFDKELRNILVHESDPKLFSLCAVYLYRADSSVSNLNFIKIKMVENFPGYDTVRILAALEDYLNFHQENLHRKIPSLLSLFKHQKLLGTKVIYSFQRWNRNFPGLAIVQQADGRFARDQSGNLLFVRQLARSGSDLPYFITNGSTPQGVYSIQGTDVSRDHLIGPTPNIQMILPFEESWGRYFHRNFQAGDDTLQLYRQLWPSDWQLYPPIMEAWRAGSIGRNSIIAHGTTIDPEFYRNQPFYPLTPTQGCLCAKEIWNDSSGHLRISDQYNLVGALENGPGCLGFVYVINLDDLQQAVSEKEVTEWVREFESR